MRGYGRPGVVFGFGFALCVDIFAFGSTSWHSVLNGLGGLWPGFLATIAPLILVAGILLLFAPSGYRHRYTTTEFLTWIVCGAAAYYLAESVVFHFVLQTHGVGWAVDGANVWFATGAAMVCVGAGIVATWLGRRITDPQVPRGGPEYLDLRDSQQVSDTDPSGRRGGRS